MEKFQVLFCNNAQQISFFKPKLEELSENYKIDYVDEISEGLKKMSQNHYDLVFTNLHLNKEFEGVCLLNESRLKKKDTKLFLVTGEERKEELDLIQLLWKPTFLAKKSFLLGKVKLLLSEFSYK